MAIFSAIGAAVAATFFAGSAIAATAVSGILALGVSYAARALMGGTNTPEAAKVDGFSAQGKLQASGDVPRSFQLGYSVTSGSLVYANSWGNGGETPNAFFTQVIALQDTPGGSLVGFWVNGEKVTLKAEVDLGMPVAEYTKNGGEHLWVRFYDGTQTTADAVCVNNVSSAERPYEATRIGTGIAYAVVTTAVDDTLFTGFPTFKFELSGIPLYDISKDTTAGGSGSHRWSDRSTWGGDGDNLPAVQIYNMLRGVTVGGQWLYGLQAMSAARLPAANWITQIQKCRTQIMGESGMEPTYRSGMQVNVDAQIANAVEALLTSCQGRLSEIGGFYKIHLGAPDSPTFSFTDDDILSTEEQTYRPFFALADSINGIAAKYPLPAEGWNTKVAPPLLRSDLETLDGGRRLLANPSFDAVPYSAQVQRLMSSALEEAQRARTHVLTLPPAYWIIEPGDVGTWTSDRNGYDGKLFRVDGVVDRANLDVGASLTEVDPADYDWDHDVDFEAVRIGPTVFERPAAQGVLDWFAVGDIIKDADGASRRPAIRLAWDGTLPGIIGVTYEVRLDADLSHVARGRTDQCTAGNLLISQSLLPNTTYGVRGQYIPSSPRDMLWSDWLTVTTPNVLAGLVEFNAGIAERVTTAIDQALDLIAQLDQLKASIGSIDIARNWLDKQTARRELSSVSGEANARITEVFTVATNLEAALAQTEETLEASIGQANSRITTTNTVLSDLTQSVAQQSQSFMSQFGTISGAITTEIQTRSTETGALSQRLDSFTAQTNSSFAAVTQQVVAQADQAGALAASLDSYTTTLNGHTATLNVLASSINGVSLQYGVIGTIDGVTGGFVLQGVRRNDGGQQFNLAIDADVIIRGTLDGQRIRAGTIDVVSLKAGQIDSTYIALNGVSLENLIRGAATSEIFTNFPTMVNPTVGSPFASTIFEVKSGTATVQIASALSALSSETGQAHLDLYVDYAFHTRWTVNLYYAANTNGGAWQSPITWTARVSGLSVGNHVFDLRRALSSGSETYDAGFIHIVDLRR